MRIRFSRGDYRRSVAKEAYLVLENRYFESDPVLAVDDDTALIARPGKRKWQNIGSGPIRGEYSQPGSFNDDAFIVSENDLYRISSVDGTPTFLGTISGYYTRSSVSFAATSNIGTTPAYLFIADGSVLWVYDGVTLSQVATPDDVGVIAVQYISSFVIVVPAQGFDINGRFYWIEPGDITIDPLNFATAEKSPDPIVQCIVFGDNFWFPSTSTTEAWFMTGDPLAPVQRLKGVAFERGAWEGTAVQVKDSMIIVDSDGAVFKIQGGEQRISTPDIEERIREAIKTLTAFTGGV